MFRLCQHIADLNSLASVFANESQCLRDFDIIDREHIGRLPSDESSRRTDEHRRARRLFTAHHPDQEVPPLHNQPRWHSCRCSKAAAYTGCRGWYRCRLQEPPPRGARSTRHGGTHRAPDGRDHRSRPSLRPAFATASASEQSLLLLLPRCFATASSDQGKLRRFAHPAPRARRSNRSANLAADFHREADRRKRNSSGRIVEVVVAQPGDRAIIQADKWHRTSD